MAGVCHEGRYEPYGGRYNRKLLETPCFAILFVRFCYL
jgi:hypothetical protein